MTDPARTTADTEETAGLLRTTLVDQLCANGAITTPAVEEAFRAVPRHRFVPDAPLEQAYANQTVSIKDNETGASISCASQPGIVALMLEQAALEPGMRVLELGAGTGYNAALLGRLVGPSGTVTTIDVDADLVEGARTRLRDVDTTNVDVLLGDGALGHPDGAPYDRIIATVGSHAVPEAWVGQLAPTGRLVAPVRIAGDVSRSIVFQPGKGRCTSVDSQLCTFIPLRGGIGDDSRRVLNVTGDGAVRLQSNQEQRIDPRQVCGVLDQPSETVWTGVDFGGMQSHDGMWLWLALTLDNAVSRMPVDKTAVAGGLVAPSLGWGTMASVPTTGPGLAYLTARPIETPQGRRYEMGVVGHAPAGHELARRMAEQITVWEPRRDQQLGFTLLPASGQAPAPGPGRFVLDRGRFRLVVSWQEQR
ncbi:methyltransferase, FxLD system [Actinorugispora endophytica]|uniref:Protein-L-isoaspartate O-methyltransferase n=1 Tax=Actinorugispora endophytica TaxID=1605990 RepID=A0A4R6V2W2_9ACTN|nr:methyltransferase, FxLD system [Actinorugispora endophytica]TDQ54380.1 protein-L-isoaspartate(D-aspartate) O-methyltransferase [Actinorugispora endophytica]